MAGGDAEDQMSKQIEALKLALGAFEADASNENFLILKHRVREALAEQPAQKTCLVANESCKHGSWCSEVYCQEHCTFIEQPAQQYNPTSDHRMMENAQGDLERIKLVQTGVGIGKPNGCQCPACKITPHASDCAVHNEPAYLKGACSCKAQPEQEPVHFPVTDNTYNYAKNLAEAIFKQHFASDEHYASGRIVWGVNDTVIGILTQIDNMVADMVRRPAQPEQEPVAWMWKDGTVTTDPDRADGTWTPLYTSPPASKPLTDAQIGAVAADIWGSVLIAPQSYQTFARAIEAAHGIKE